jgi:DNA topoisomerase IB
MLKSLTHNGVLLPQSFESKGFNKIDNIEISLLAEEMLWKYSPYMFNRFQNDEVFIKNVWTDLKPQLPKELQNKEFPKDFTKLFVAMRVASENLKLQKSEYNKSHKKEIEKEKNERKEKYGFCYKNGKKTEVGNFVTEGSRWFISRGDLRGRWVSSVNAENVEINSSDKVPCTQEGHNWKKVELRDTDYIATYKINIGFGTAYVDKFVWLSANSEDKQKDNEHKYEKARKLLLKIDEIEKTVLKDIRSKNKLKRENALITYVVLTYGIRIGNDLGEDNFRDKNVRGASTLCVENMKLESNNKIHLEFVGKDSVFYSETMEVEPTVYEQFSKQLSGKKSSDKIYDLATSSTVNAYLKSIYDGEISPKLFRTAKGSGLLAEEIQKREWKNLTDKEFKNNLMECCLQTSLLLNHHKTVTEEQKEKSTKSAENKIESAKNALKRTKESAEKKLEKLKKDKKDFKDCLEGKLLEEKLNEIKIKEKELKDKIFNAEKKYNDILKEVEFKQSTLDVNLGTALNAYSTPKLPMSLCKYADKDPSIIYSKTQLKKFEWAKKVSKDFWRKYPNV